MNEEVDTTLRTAGNYLKRKILPTVVKLAVAFVVGYLWCMFLISLTIACRQSDHLRDRLIFELFAFQWSFYLPLGFAGIVGYLLLKLIFRMFHFPSIKRH